jgi:gamma-glutamylcysteine synthetase
MARPPEGLSIAPPEVTRDAEEEMKMRFWEKAYSILGQESRFRHPSILKVGLEVEASLLTPDFFPAAQITRDQVVAENEKFADCELGAAQLEWRTDPVVLQEDGLKVLVAEFEQKEIQIKRSVAGQAHLLLLSGSNPFVPVSEIVRTVKVKYQQVPDYHNQHRDPNLTTRIGIRETVDVGDAAVIALANSVQCNVQAADFDDAVDMLNRSFAIGPMAVAMSGNARFLEGTDTGLSDLRMIAWEVSHDTRSVDEKENGKVTRVGLPEAYYRDLRDYFERISDYPFILYNPDYAFEVGIGLNWRDTRIKFINDSLVVEFRPVSTQPTAVENLAVVLFYLGRLEWSRQNDELLTPLEIVRYNRDQAMSRGLQGSLISGVDGTQKILSAPEALKLEIDRAQEGLIRRGFKQDEVRKYLGILRDRLGTRRTPSERLARKFYELKKKGFSESEALVLAVNECGGLR